MSVNTGKITQVIGPVIDVSFDTEKGPLPNILDSLVITRANGEKVVLECQQHIGEDTVRAIAMDASDGLSRGMAVVSTGSPIMMPIGEDIRGRLFNVVGDPIDGLPALPKENGSPIHRNPPKFEDLTTSAEVSTVVKSIH